MDRETRTANELRVKLPLYIHLRLRKPRLDSGVDPCPEVPRGESRSQREVFGEERMHRGRRGGN